MKYIALHHTAVSRAAQTTQLNAVDRYHKQKWGMQSSLGWYVGYNYFCDVNGTITNTRAVGEETIAQQGHNCDHPSRCDTISFCFAGDFNRELPNDKQIKAFRKWRHDNKRPKIVGHRDLQANRTCPGQLMTDSYIKERLLGHGGYADMEDKEKAKKIRQLYSMLDQLRALLRKLRATNDD